MRIDVIGSERNGLPEAGDRRLEFAAFLADDPEIVMSVDQLGVELQRLFEGRPRGVEIAGVEQRDAEVVGEIRRRRAQSGGLAQMLGGLACIPLLPAHDAQPVLGIGVAGVEPQNLAEQCLRLAPTAGLKGRARLGEKKCRAAGRFRPPGVPGASLRAQSPALLSIHGASIFSSAARKGPRKAS